VEEAERRSVPCGGGGQRHTAAHGAAGRAMALGRRESEVGDEAGGSDWVGLGRAGRAATRLKGFFWAKNERKKENWLQNYFSNFSNKDLILKAKDSNTFKLNLN
jgi:hypothetical protein